MRVVFLHGSGSMCSIHSPPVEGNEHVAMQHNHQGKLVLVVQEDADLRRLLCDIVHELELEVAEATDGDGAIRAIRELNPHLLVTDLRIPGGGFDNVRTIRDLHPSCPIILLAPLGDHDARAEALACGVKAFFLKPVRVGDLQRAIIEGLDGERTPRD